MRRDDTRWRASSSRANACPRSSARSHGLPSTGFQAVAGLPQLVVRQTAVERLLRKDTEVSYNITSLKCANDDVLTLGFSTAELRCSSLLRRGRTALLLATDVVALLNELRAKAAAPAPSARSAASRKGRRRLAFAGIWGETGWRRRGRRCVGWRRRIVRGRGGVLHEEAEGTKALLNAVAPVVAAFCLGTGAEPQ